MQSNSSNVRIEYLSFASVVSAFAVLILHTNGCFWTFSATEQYWKSANVIECVFYFAVPVFFMISGITLLDFYDKYTLKEYFVRRLERVVIPFLVWSLIGVAFRLHMGELKIEEITFRFLIKGIVGTSIIGIYWFFPPLFCIYLSIPLFAAVEKEKKIMVFSYTVAVGFLLNILIPFIRAIFGISFQIPYTLPALSGYLIWPLTGYLLHNLSLNKWAKIIIYMLSAAGLAMHIGGTYILSMRAGKLITLCKGYVNVPGVLYSIGVFQFLKDFGSWIMKVSKSTKSIIMVISRYTFEIYLMQFILLTLFPRLNLVSTRSLVYRLGAPFLMAPVIMLATWILRRIPIVRHIVP